MASVVVLTLIRSYVDGDDRPRSSVVEHWTRYLKVASWGPAGGKISFRPFFFLHNYITIPSNHNTYTFPGIIFF